MSNSFDFSKIVEPVKEILEKYKDQPNIEVEGRLGVYNNDENKFDTNIGEEYYTTIKKMLNSCIEWKGKEEISTTDTFSGGLRLTTNNKSAQQFCIKKKKLAEFTFINETGPLDMRISIATEEPVRVESYIKKGTQKQREKSRNQYFLGDYSYDLTKVLTTENGEPTEYYEYEVEFQEEFEDKCSGQIIFSIMMKLLDASVACDEVPFIKTKDNSLPLDNTEFSLFLSKEIDDLTGKLKELTV